ncbi:methyltransferase [Croceibacterium mercuriale]|uniref:Methyltransferase n=1 Tax=Croceibacterium mercuriale TaxID=1572751 RepID=A0A0B2C201_9SPHN|nr:16S rRNA (guanine(966)-N(2))-methyltransferase RsmD [Croceibacterium mercuriale]KHL26046.1 methyltransferase [Croceibacterium mercuriale]
MRIIAGEWRRHPLRAPSGEVTRPSGDRTRETLFSMLASRLGTFEGLVVADLFAGSGALGLEALSRGAASCLFVEQDAEALRVLRANIAALRAQTRAIVHAGSATQIGAPRQMLDLVLLDPPYGSGAGGVALDRMARLGWIGPSSWVALEVAAREEVRLPAFTIDTERKVGSARLVVARPSE